MHTVQFLTVKLNSVILFKFELLVFDKIISQMRLLNYFHKLILSQGPLLFCLFVTLKMPKTQ